MQRLSSNFTLFLKLFIPVSWATFFGLFGIVIFILDPNDEPFLTSSMFRIGYVIFYLTFLIIGYFTFFQLKRVEEEEEHIFVTDYFKTVKFPIENVVRISLTNFGLFKVSRFHLANKGYFGKKIPFIIKGANYHDFVNRYPKLIK